MAYQYPPQNQPYGNNLNFYNSGFQQPPPGGVSGSTTPFQTYGGTPSQSGFAGFSNVNDLSGNMGQSGSGLTNGWLAAFGAEGYPGEPPLLEELGVNFSHIKLKARGNHISQALYTANNPQTITVLNPFGRIDTHIMDDSDLAGPVLFFLLFGFFLLFSGKIHFGYIYGLALIGSIALNFIFSLMSPPISPVEQGASDSDGHASGSRIFSSTLTIARSASILGCTLSHVFNPC